MFHDDGPLFDDSPCPGLYAVPDNSPSTTMPKASTPRARTSPNWTTQISRPTISSKPSIASWNELLDYPSDKSSQSSVARQRIHLHGTRNYHRRSSKLDPTYCDDLFNDCPPSSRLVARISVSDRRTKTATNPFIKAYIDRVQATVLIDTGATSSFITASFWHRLGQPPLKQPRLGFVTADNSNLDILGRAKFSFHLAGANVSFPFCVMSTSLTDCIVGLDLLPYLGAIINLKDNTLTLSDRQRILSLEPLDGFVPTSHPVGLTTVAETITVPPRSVRHVPCLAGLDLPSSTTFLVEPRTNTQAQIAAALYCKTSSNTT
ncbi:hypothetical protein H257_18375 [Aphanomyces astaci]|uniref:Peptidase A2 domain-containing protein n=1 Tax=Aphanomyces astaci TaxID=112090 RepID=W4FBC5_APHAT|nr:hypothetical protein H257_18375 [Aphanomyces astaci]ETV64800.1 hypothetical protein H257_18375 [Aphanomyces astaci]|eukprot:XP_009845719.1 hypothetical protein H257_18375 [Aphanomyces astaci]